MTITLNKVHNVCYNRKRMESFWGMPKFEMYDLGRSTDSDELILAIEHYITFFNTGRFQKRLRCMTAMEFHYAYAV